MTTFSCDRRDQVSRGIWHPSFDRFLRFFGGDRPAASAAPKRPAPAPPANAAFAMMFTFLFGWVSWTGTSTSSNTTSTSFDCSAQTEIPVHECELLLALFESTGGNSWTNHTGWLAGNISDWFGIVIEGGFVTEISLPNNELSGAVPWQIGNPTMLEVLDLSGNHLTGHLPEELGDLSWLEILDLSENALEGLVPWHVASTATLHPDFKDPLFCSFSGNDDLCLPDRPEFRDLTELGSICGLPFRSDCPVPAYSYDCSTQTDITQAECEALTDLFHATDGVFWAARRGWMTRSVPEWHGVAVADGHVAEVQLQWNFLAGPIPASIGDLSALTTLSLDGNALCGGLPPAIGSLVHLTRLSVGVNGLCGDIPSELGNLTSLTHLNLGQNALSGSIPSSLFNLEDLETLVLSGNALDGEIPLALTALTNLDHLYLENNALHGCIPHDLAAFLVELATCQLFGNADLCIPDTPEYRALTPGEGICYLEFDAQCEGILPITITSFSAVAAGSDVALHWTAEGEAHFFGFGIQRSTNGKEFDEVGWVDAAALSSGPLRYGFTDTGLPTASGLLSYRLRLVSLDGVVSFSPTTELEWIPPSAAWFGAYPNPFRSSVRIWYDLPVAGNVTVTLFDALGRTMARPLDAYRPAGRLEADIALENASAGIYFYRIRAGSREVVGMLSVLE